MTGRAINIVSAVDNVAFGLGYACLGREGWTQERCVSVAQMQVFKIRSQLYSEK